MIRKFHGWLTRHVLYPVNLWQKGIRRADLAAWWGRDEWTPAQMLAYQRQRLSGFLAYARQHCPYYRRQFHACGLDLEGGDPFVEIRKLPPLTKSDVRDHLEGLFSEEFKGRPGLIKKATGGSTGQPLVVWGDREDYRLNGLAIARQRRWIGWYGGMETLTIFGGFRDVPSTLRRTAKRWLINETFINNMARENGDYDRLAERLARRPPESIIAYFSSLRALAEACERRGQRLQGIRLAIACAEPLDERARAHAEHWMGTKIYFQYGCRELGTFAQECRLQQGYHYGQDIGYAEVLDEQGQPADYGHLTITYFGNRVVPLIRYQIGDGAALDITPCACGLPYHRLKLIDGRISAMVQTPDGRQISSILFPHLFKEYDWIAEFQVEQVAPDRIVMRVRRRAVAYTERSRGELEARLRSLMGADIHLEWRWDEPFRPVPTGKHVYFLPLPR